MKIIWKKCYLIVQNANPKYETVALGQTYFAIQTRKVELTEEEYGRLKELKDTVDKKKAKKYFEKIEGRKLLLPRINIKIDNFLRKFILSGGFDIEISTEEEPVHTVHTFDYDIGSANNELTFAIADNKVEYDTEQDDNIKND